jgi:hypothetical protein
MTTYCPNGCDIIGHPQKMQELSARFMFVRNAAIKSENATLNFNASVDAAGKPVSITERSGRREKQTTHRERRRHRRVRFTAKYQSELAIKRLSR